MVIIHNTCIFTILMYLFFLSTSQRNNTRSDTRPRKIVIDTDAGADDALAIILALEHEKMIHDIEVIAITCTYGNTYLKNVEQNVLKTLTIANRSDIPVYSGAEKPLINTYSASNFFGTDGFGDFNFTETITAKLNKTKHASVALVDLVKQYPGEITIISLGPLTNIATAIALQPSFLHNLKEFVIMGTRIPSENDNEDNNIEFNFSQDPESNWMALNNTNKPSIIFPINAVIVNPISKEEYRNIYDNLDKSIAVFLHQAERISLEKTEFWEPSDGMTVASILESQIITQSFETNLNPVLVGNGRGSVQINYNNEVHNALVIEQIDKIAFKDLLLKYLC